MTNNVLFIILQIFVFGESNDSGQVFHDHLHEVRKEISIVIWPCRLTAGFHQYCQLWCAVKWLLLNKSKSFLILVP